MLNSKDDLEYPIGNENIQISSLYNKINQFNKAAVEKYKGITYKLDIKNASIILNINKEHINIFFKGIEFQIFKTKTEGIFYSYEHLDQLLKKYEITDPIYRTSKGIDIKYEEIKKNDAKVIIYQRDEIINFKEIYDDMKNKYKI